MSNATKEMRKALEHSTDALEMINFNEGFEACLDGIDVLSNVKHNNGETVAAGVLRWAAKELRGENVDA